MAEAACLTCTTDSDERWKTYLMTKFLDSYIQFTRTIFCSLCPSQLLPLVCPSQQVSSASSQLASSLFVIWSFFSNAEMLEQDLIMQITPCSCSTARSATQQRSLPRKPAHNGVTEFLELYLTYSHTFKISYDVATWRLPRYVGDHGFKFPRTSPFEVTTIKRLVSVATTVLYKIPREVTPSAEWYGFLDF